MKITKYGHCCLLIETGGLRILTDPGIWSEKLSEIANIDIILITHEHTDHMHIEGIQEVLSKSQNVEVIANGSVSELLRQVGITCTILEERAETDRKGISIKALDGEHAEIFRDFGLVQNTGYFIDNKLFYPGDSYTTPEKPVELLALPVAGPWCKSADSLRFAIEANPKAVIPVHDALLNDEGLKLTYGLFSTQLDAHGIRFVPVKNFETNEF